MKKTIMTIAIVLTMGLGAYAQYDEDKFGIQPWFGEASLLGRDGGSIEMRNGDNAPLLLPSEHGLNYDVNSPLGSGIAVLLGLGGAYLIAKKRKEE